MPDNSCFAELVLKFSQGQLLPYPFENGKKSIFLQFLWFVIGLKPSMPSGGF